MSNLNYIWKDKKRHFGLPLSFTEYSLSEDRLFEKTGLLTTKQDETLLYRVRDISVTRTLWQKMCGVGTITINTVDASTPIIHLENITNVDEVKETLHSAVEQQKAAKNMRFGEIYDAN